LNKKLKNNKNIAATVAKEYGADEAKIISI
jgi:hypothetical protein